MSEKKSSKKYEKSLVWFRRDLRDYDHAALYHALKSSHVVYCVFIFDTDILEKLNNKADRRVEFIWHSLVELKNVLQKKGGDLIVQVGRAVLEIPKIALQLNVKAVFTNHDVEPSAIARDAEVAESLTAKKINFHHFKDHVIFEKDEVLSKAGKPYGVFTPYKNMWLTSLNDFYLKAYPIDLYLDALKSPESFSNALVQMPSLEEVGFEETNLAQLRLPTGMTGGLSLFEDFVTRMEKYQEARNFPAVKGVSYLSVHLRFGTISVRHLARIALQAENVGAQTWLNELIWRDFYSQILYHHPRIAEGHAYKAEYEHLSFPNNVRFFKAWCDGQTGYPLVDAAMRQLNQTGFMHNRLRMVAASFLVKDLLVDWRWGERYFAEKLIDFDLSANNGGWQWAASTGCDAQPWFRIFNPITQSEKFDAQGKFIRKYVPELKQCHDKEIHAPWLIPPLRLQSLALRIGEDYPAPIVDHAEQRKHALDLYQQASR